MRAWVFWGLALVACGGEHSVTSGAESTDSDAGSESSAETEPAVTESDGTELAEPEPTDPYEEADDAPGTIAPPIAEGGTPTSAPEPDAGAQPLDGGAADASDSPVPSDASASPPDAAGSTSDLTDESNEQDAAMASETDTPSNETETGEWVVCEGSVNATFESGPTITPGECAFENYEIMFAEPVDYSLEVYVSEFGALFVGDLLTTEASLAAQCRAYQQGEAHQPARRRSLAC